MVFMGKQLEKLNNVQYKDYWINSHLTSRDDLEPVCFRGKPRFFNLFFDRIQKYALDQYIEREGINLQGTNLLDIGCGRGRWLTFFGENYQALTTGLDISINSLKTCNQRGLNAICGSVISLPLANETFDFISSITVLLHIPNDLKEKTISELYRVLKPGGSVILIESTWDDPAPHVFALKLADWESLFNDAGFILAFRWGHCYNKIRRSVRNGINAAQHLSSSLREGRLDSTSPRNSIYMTTGNYLKKIVWWLLNLVENLAIFLDYPIEYYLMRKTYSKESKLGMQHLMVFKK